MLPSHGVSTRLDSLYILFHNTHHPTLVLMAPYEILKLMCHLVHLRNAPRKAIKYIYAQLIYAHVHVDIFVNASV